MKSKKTKFEKIRELLKKEGAVKLNIKINKKSIYENDSDNLAILPIPMYEIEAEVSDDAYNYIQKKEGKVIEVQVTLESSCLGLPYYINTVEEVNEE